MADTKKTTALDELTTPAVGDVLMIVDISEPLDVDKNKKITTVSLGTILTTLSNLIEVGFATTNNIGDSGAAKTVDWTLGNRQRIRLTGNVDLSLTDPAKACALTLELIGDGTARTPVADFDADCEWATDGEPPGYGDTNNEVVGLLHFNFDPDTTPKYVVAGIGVGV